MEREQTNVTLTMTLSFSQEALSKGSSSNSDSLFPSTQSAEASDVNADPTSSFLCRRMGWWGDVCTYTNVCYDGRVFYFLEAGGCTGSLKDCPEFYEDSDLYEGLIHPEREPSEAAEQPFPFNGGAWFVCTL